jgi:hypothetical protein
MLERFQSPKTTADQRADLAETFAALQMKSAVVPLRNAFASEQDPFAKSHLASALVELGDEASHEPVMAFCRSVEQKVSSAWERCFDALAADEKGRAYVVDLAKRIPAIKTSWDETEARRILPVLMKHQTREALPTLVRWSADANELRDHTFGLIQGARIRLGDEKLASRVRVDLGKANATVPAWPETWVDGLGGHPGDVPALLRFASSTAPESRLAYDAIDRLIPLLPEGAPARKELHAGLVRLTSHRENRQHVQFEARMLARHHASLARLGHAPAKQRLRELTQGDFDTVIPWVAARHALELQLPGAVDDALRVVLAGRRADPRFGEVRVDLVRTAASVLGNADPRWAAGLLDAHTMVRETTLRLLARGRPAGACDIVAAEARGAQEDAADDALLALTLTPDNRCDAALVSLVEHKDTSPRLRAVALETRILMRRPGAAGHLAALAETDATRLVKQTGARIAARGY